MTVILDPGTDANSFDATPKLWRLTAGQWKTKDGTDVATIAARDATIASDATTLATRTSERDSARNSIYVSGTYGSGPTWQAQDAADLAADAATLATRTSERDTARNSLYVSGTYLSGQTWQTKDGTDLANYNAEVTAYNAQVAATAAATPPGSLDMVTGGNISTTFAGSAQEMMRLTVDRTGYWVAAGWLSWANSTAEGADFTTTLGLVFAGSTQYQTNFTTHANDHSGGGGVMSTTAILLSNGQTISMYANKGYSLTITTAVQALRAYFVPTASYPH